MTEVTEVTTKKMGKVTHGLGWRMPAAARKVHNLNYKGNVGWLKRCSENYFIMALSRKVSVM